MPDVYAKYQRLLFDRPHPRVLRVTMHNPERLNSADEIMHGELATIWQDIDKDPSVSLSWTLAKASTELPGSALKYDETALAEMLSAKHFVEVRKTLGGPAPEETARASDVSRQLLEADETWWSVATSALTEAERQLAVRSAAL